jgi:hypothetical protein
MKYSCKDFLDSVKDEDVSIKEIKSFKGIEDCSWKCEFYPNKSTIDGKHWDWEIWDECDDTPEKNAIHLAFKKGGTKIEKEIVHFMEHYYEEMVYENRKPGQLTMYHGTRRLISFRIINGKPYIHYQNSIENNFDKYKGINNDGNVEIKGRCFIDGMKYLTDTGRRYCDEVQYYNEVDWKKELLNIFNKHLKM